MTVMAAFVVTTLHLAYAADSNEAKPSANWWLVHYEPLESLKAVPASVLKELSLKIPDDPRLADRNEPFNATDVVDPTLPRRRFTFGGTSPQFVIVCYEHGGRGRHHHVTVFAMTDEKPQLIFIGRYAQKVQAIDDIKYLVRKGIMKNEIEDTHKEF